jgi:hypothetical protein
MYEESKRKCDEFMEMLDEKNLEVSQAKRIVD